MTSTSSSRPEVVLSAIPQLPPPSTKSKKQPRPSTAPPTEEKANILPSVPSGSSINDLSPTSDIESVGNVGCTNSYNGEQGMFEVATMTDKERDTFASLANSDLETPPSPFETPAHDSRTSASSTSIQTRPEVTADYDWAEFIGAYASGRWDPHRTPTPPRSYSSPPASFVYATSEPASSDPLPDPNVDPLEHHSHAETVPLAPTETPPVSSPPIPIRKTPSNLSINLPLPSYRLHGSFSDLRPATSNSTIQSPASDFSSFPDSSLSPDVTTTAATMRWAAARVNLSPLALPSPEHELTDPMRGVTATIPGSHPTEVYSHYEPRTPGGGRLRLSSFWQGTQDVDESLGHTLATIEASPPSTPNSNRSNSSSSKTSERSNKLQWQNVPPAVSAPILHMTEGQVDDYFGNVEVGVAEQSLSLRESRGLDALPLDAGTISAPVLPRRVNLTRQSSSPLPSIVRPDQRISSGRINSDSTSSLKASRAAKEEQTYNELGFLTPPNPSDEFERRRALHKFNIWKTGPDLNFDRIAHLAKLVFNTKGVFISLINETEQWFKSDRGMKIPSISRAYSLCAHTILQRGDEPMVILDTSQDWRFIKNPLVTGAPQIKFYAGAPLRTQDGYNVGTLAVVDDAPRQDFTPRQRHTLKEFAAIAMREMELWRDKIQLRIRDRIQTSMEQFSRECLEIDTEAQARTKDGHPDIIVGASMDRVYDRAAKLVKQTLDVEAVIVLDVTHCEVLETMSAEGSVSVVIHHGDSQKETTTRSLSTEEYAKLNAFFTKYPNGKISEGVVPFSFRSFLPKRIQYALTVPIFNIDKRPFALLCAYNELDHTKRFLEGHELSYLRAIGVIILSAVLKRRMILADKAKSLFISNISHELRTPLHGILAAAELLTETPLNHSQSSFLQTVQACGTSLVETVNHVLDFTKLSGNSKSGGVDNVILPTRVDLMQLVEEAVDGCWIGHRARMSILRDSEIGSVYSPPTVHEQGRAQVSPIETRVETIVDIGLRKGGWNVICEKGGLRRVLMNVFSNSLKFTSEGYVHVSLRQLPSSEDGKIKIELSVLDTGKGISQNFLKNQLFHPFSQENPLQTGTGLGLAIVHSIVQSESVGGKVDVWSEEGVGTDIKVQFSAELPEDDTCADSGQCLKFDDPNHPPSVSLVGFDIHKDKGQHLLYHVLSTYLVSWWGLELRSGDEDFGDVVVINEDPSPITQATERRDTSRPFIILSALRGSPKLMSVAVEYEKLGGFCRVLYKPGGPSRLRSVLQLSLHSLKINRRSLSPDDRTSSNHSSPNDSDDSASNTFIHRRNSDHIDIPSRPLLRPVLNARAVTVHPDVSSWSTLSSPPGTPEKDQSSGLDSPFDEQSARHTIPVGIGGTLLKSSVGTIEHTEHDFKVLVVEDNSILRHLLVKWLSSKGYNYREAVDGRDGVNIFESGERFDVVLLDLSMPILDGIGATAEIRQIEASRSPCNSPTCILALTGMSSLEDKRRAFEAGVDGYLVKPVAFKTLDAMFHKLGISQR